MQVLINNIIETIKNNLFILIRLKKFLIWIKEKIIEINIDITPNIGADNRKNKPKLKKKNPNLYELTSLKICSPKKFFKKFFNEITIRYLQNYN